jgi:hypothetical protein
MMGAVSLVTFIAGAAGVGEFVCAESSGANWKRQSAMNKGRKFIFKNSI